MDVEYWTELDGEAVFEEKSVCRKNQNKSAEKHKTQNIKQTQYSNAKYQINLTFCVLRGYNLRTKTGNIANNRS